MKLYWVQTPEHVAQLVEEYPGLAGVGNVFYGGHPELPICVKVGKNRGFGIFTWHDGKTDDSDEEPSFEEAIRWYESEYGEVAQTIFMPIATTRTIDLDKIL